MHKYLFISNVLPNDDVDIEINTQKATYLAQKGIMDALSQNVEELVVLSYPQYPVYPKSSIIYRKSKKRIEGNVEYIRIPTVNLPIIRIIFRNLLFWLYILKWCFKNRKENKHIIQYNVSSPSLFITLLAKLFRHTDISAFLYDLGMPPSSYHYSIFKRVVFKIIDLQAKILINKLDYAFVITTAVARDYASKTKTKLVDGGISEDVLSHIPLPDYRQRNKTIFLLAGNLTETNGVKLCLEAMKLITDNNIELWFAGKGDSVELIKKEASANPQILYKGFLSTEQLFNIYASVDVLLNLRVMSGDEGIYLFPSKLLEYMTTGRIVISTDFAHVRDVYCKFCYILDSPTPDALAQMILNVSRNKNDSIGVVAQEFMLANRTWTVQMNAIVDLLEKTKQ